AARGGELHRCDAADQGGDRRRVSLTLTKRMMPPVLRAAPRRRSMVTFASVVMLGLTGTRAARAQEADPRPAKRDTVGFPNTIAGEFTPGSGYDIIKTARGSLNISVYGLFRY